ATVGLLAGFAFLLLIDYITPHLHLDGDQEGPESHLSKTTMLSLAVTIHNLPEGMAVGVAIAGALSSDVGMSVAGALALSLGIAIQNIPEGAIISMPLRAVGNTRLRSFGIDSLSGIVEPIGGLLVLLLASIVTPMMPYLLAFAAGAMLYVVIEELIPEASTGKHSNISTVGFAVGFALMMVLDVVLG
ncbi:MAG: ZIP family metal transporter, partial [Bacteroidales bacterium]|nr:ZIP family metal transporter [Bacteroidales bacterium]